MSSFSLRGVTVTHKTRCYEIENCVCPAVVEPVCGDDAVTYNNKCEAECRLVPQNYHTNLTLSINNYTNG